MPSESREECFSRKQQSTTLTDAVDKASRITEMA